MGWSWALVCSGVLVLVLLSAASKDERRFEQREVTFDIGEIVEVLPPGSAIMQEEVTFRDFNREEFKQMLESSPEYKRNMRERGYPRPGVLTPRGRRPSFGPHSFGGSPMFDYPVQFPLGRPTSDNLQAICLHGNHRPRYPNSYFPESGYGQGRRRAEAVNMGEFWFSTCCKGNQTWEREVTLCCATQAWELSVELFCEADTSVKDRIYHCCRLDGTDLLNCFKEDAPNPNYEPTEKLPVPSLPLKVNFSFDLNTCQRTVMTPHSIRTNKKKEQTKPSTSQKIDIIFPPGRPTADAVESLCRNQKLRPLYNVKCLTGSGYEWVARQAKAINRIEKGFKRCCKKKRDVLNCADQKWREELDKFCLAENGAQVDFNCCLGDRENDRYNCFMLISPDPHYNNTAPSDEFSLNKICDTHKIIKKRFPVGFPLKTFLNDCCPLSEEERSTCSVQKLNEMSNNLCSSRKTSPPAVSRCCSMASQEIPKCISKILMDAITKATNVLRQKKRKRCPLS
ncbi:extracellular matrix protein 1 [Embiotoca jacksoni]|uniref:extracellular matrix protein 1 n=1 Tax=Embiotoca jacksoni TaxID=100190 RepID=UPI003703BC4C